MHACVSVNCFDSTWPVLRLYMEGLPLSHQSQRRKTLEQSVASKGAPILLPSMLQEGVKHESSCSSTARKQNNVDVSLRAMGRKKLKTQSSTAESNLTHPRASSHTKHTNCAPPRSGRRRPRRAEQSLERGWRRSPRSLPGWQRVGRDRAACSDRSDVSKARFSSHARRPSRRQTYLTRSQTNAANSSS